MPTSTVASTTGVSRSPRTHKAPSGESEARAASIYSALPYSLDQPVVDAHVQAAASRVEFDNRCHQMFTSMMRPADWEHFRGTCGNDVGIPPPRPRDADKTPDGIPRLSENPCAVINSGLRTRQMARPSRPQPMSAPIEGIARVRDVGPNSFENAWYVLQAPVPRTTSTQVPPQLEESIRGSSSPRRSPRSRPTASKAAVSDWLQSSWGATVQRESLSAIARPKWRNYAVSSIIRSEMDAVKAASTHRVRPLSKSPDRGTTCQR